MAVVRSLTAALLLAASVAANPFVLRRDTTSATTTTPTAGLVQTTINGVLTTVTLGVPPAGTTTTTSTGTGTGTTTTSTTGTAQSSTDSAPTSAPTSSNEAVSMCDNTIDQPMCSPANGQTLEVGNSYLFIWSPNAFQTNTTIMVGLQYNNESRVAYMSSPMPKERGLTLVTIDPTWLDGWDQLNLTLFWVAYDAGSPSSSSSPHHIAYNVTIVPKPVEHLPASIHRGKPSTESLVIALPIVLGFIVLLVLGLFFGMRAKRHIGLGSIMGRGRRGYGTNKSRRQRLGIKKGAIRLEDREIMAPVAGDYRDRQSDDISPAPRQDGGWPVPPGGPQGGIRPGHQRDVSLGSLLTDGSARNSFRTDGRP